MGTNLLNVVWSYGKEGAGLSTAVAAAGVLFTRLIGGWDGVLILLCVLMGIDFLLGFLAAIKNKALDSKVMFWGGINKLLVLVFVAIGAHLDNTFALSSPYIRTAIIWFYMGREGLSCAENCGKMGFELPPIIGNLLAQIKDKGDTLNGVKGDDDNKRD